MLGAGQPEVFAEDFQERLVRRDHDRCVLAIDAQAYGDAVRDRHAPTLDGKARKRDLDPARPGRLGRLDPRGTNTLVRRDLWPPPAENREAQQPRAMPL